MVNRSRDTDWAQQVPDQRWEGPYRDYGWESGESGLPEFRDPSVHRNAGEARWTDNWSQPGPYTGVGPKGYERSDDRILDDVCQRLTQHGMLDASNIEVEVHNGEVTLDGQVEDRRAKRMAEDTAESVPGVWDVHNNLTIENRAGSARNWVDRVGRSGVYPASASNAPGDARAQGMMSWGQGERGAQGYYDHGESEIHPSP